MGLVLEMPHASARRDERAAALATYAALVAYVEDLAKNWGWLTPAAVCVQLRLACVLWAALNSRLNAPWLQADPEWEDLRKNFEMLTKDYDDPFRHPKRSDVEGVRTFVKRKLNRDFDFQLLNLIAQSIPA